jgi:hypothetical protein
MNNFKKSFLSYLVISFLSVFVLTNVSFAFDVPGVPGVPDKSDPGSPPNPPDKVDPTNSPPSVPTVPPVPTFGNGGSSSPTPTVKPGDGNGGGNNGGSSSGSGGVGGTSDGGSSGSSSSNNNSTGQVLGLSATSSDNKDEIVLMIAGLIIASIGFKGVIAKKLKI